MLREHGLDKQWIVPAQQCFKPNYDPRVGCTGWQLLLRISSHTAPDLHLVEQTDRLETGGDVAIHRRRSHERRPAVTVAGLRANYPLISSTERASALLLGQGLPN